MVHLRCCIGQVIKDINFTHRLLGRFVFQMAECLLHPHERVIEITVGISHASQIVALERFNEETVNGTDIVSLLQTIEPFRFEFLADLAVRQLARVQLVRILQTHQSHCRT